MNPNLRGLRSVGTCRALLRTNSSQPSKAPRSIRESFWIAWRNIGVNIKRVINAGGIPQKNNVLNQIYANVLGRPVLVPGKSVTSLGSAIFAFLAAGTFKTVEEAHAIRNLSRTYSVYALAGRARNLQTRCTPCINASILRLVEPGIGKFGDVLPTLISVAAKAERARASMFAL